MIIGEFNEGYQLIGYSTRKNDKDEERTTLHFIYKLGASFNGFATMHISIATEKLNNMLNSKEPTLNAVYRVYTDKFLTKDNQLITYLKDLVKISE